MKTFKIRYHCYREIEVKASSIAEAEANFYRAVDEEELEPTVNYTEIVETTEV